MPFKLLQQNASTLLFGSLAFLVLSSKNIIIYNEEILIGLSFLAFLFFSSMTMGESIREAFTFRKETIQKELQKYLDVKEALVQDLLIEYKKTLALGAQIAQLREQSCQELKTLHSTREAGLQATFATQVRNKLHILSQIEQKGQETVQRNWQQGLKYGVLEAFRQSKKNGRTTTLTSSVGTVKTRTTQVIQEMASVGKKKPTDATAKEFTVFPRLP